MPRLCTICIHSERTATDGALVAGQSLAAIAALYRVSQDAVSRHRAHLPPAMPKATWSAPGWSLTSFGLKNGLDEEWA